MITVDAIYQDDMMEGFAVCEDGTQLATFWINRLERNGYAKARKKAEDFAKKAHAERIKKGWKV